MKSIARRQRRLQRRQREGVVLLVVLSLLALFIVVCTTFLVLATTYSRGAKGTMKADQLGDPPDKLADMALYQLLRGTRDPNSVIRGHDLLGDFYGTDGFVGFAAAMDFAGGANNATRSQLIDIAVNPNPPLAITSIYGKQSGLRSTINY
jgi:hypothetical protein